MSKKRKEETGVKNFREYGLAQKTSLGIVKRVEETICIERAITPMTLDGFYFGHDRSRQLFEVVRLAIDGIGAAELRVTKSQVAFRRDIAFAWVWRPEQYLRRPAPPLVRMVGLRRRRTSACWKSIVEPRPGRFTHHLELYSAEDIDEEVRGWLREAWEEGGSMKDEG